MSPVSIIIAVLILSFIIFFHELGHFLLAKANKIRVIEFSLGMGPRIVSFVRGGTRYSWKVLPFGGSCQMAGEYSGMDGEYEEENAAPPANPEEGSFLSKNPWRRLSVVLAGPAFNFILAYILSVILIALIGVDKPTVLSVAENYGAEAAGIEAGDTITEINGKKIHLYRDISNYVTFHQKRLATGEPVTVSWIHDGEKRTGLVTPMDNGEGRYILGITGSSNNLTKLNAGGVLLYSFYEVGYWISTTWDSLGMLFTGGASLNDMSGPVGVVSVIGETYEESLQDGAFYVVVNMLSIAILLTANLGVMNLLPFPALDGGRALMLMIEGLTHRRIKPEIENRINLAGLMLLMMLMVVVMFNDIRKLM